MLMKNCILVINVVMTLQVPMLHNVPYRFDQMRLSSLSDEVIF